MAGSSDRGLSKDLLDDILWNIENGPPAKRRRTGTRSPSVDGDAEAPWFAGYGPVAGADDVVLLSSDGLRLTAKLDFLQQYSYASALRDRLAVARPADLGRTFFDDLSDIPQPEGSRVALPPIQLDAPAHGVDVMLKLLPGIDHLDISWIYSDSFPSKVPWEWDGNLRTTDSIHVYRLADYLDCHQLHEDIVRLWRYSTHEDLLELLAACSRLDDMPVARVIIALSSSVFGDTDTDGYRVGYAAENWSQVVGKLRAEWQTEPFQAFWERTVQLVPREADQNHRNARGRKMPRRREVTYVDAGRSAQEIADRFFATVA